MKNRKLCKILSCFCAFVIAVSVCMCSISYAQTNTEWALYYWGFENTISDAAGKLTSGSEGSFAQGKQGQALDIASNGAIQTKNLDADTTKGFTMAAWIYLNEGAEGYNIIMSSGNTQINGAERFQLHIGQASESLGGGYLLAFAPCVDPDAFPRGEGLSDQCIVHYDTWTHVAVTFNGEKAVVYINGSPVAEQTATGILNSGSYHQLTIGALNHDGSTFSFNGLIDEAIYGNYPMKADQIAALASNPSAAAQDLEGWAKGTKNITPDNIVTPASPTTDPSAQPAGGNTVYYWPMEDSSLDISHRQIDIDGTGIGLEYTEGVVGQGLDTSFTPAISVPFTEAQNLECFTVSFWTRWDGSAPNGYGVMFAAGAKETLSHFEVYIKVDETGDAFLAFYASSLGAPIEKICQIDADKLYHVACTYDGSNLVIYINGESVLNIKASLKLSEFGSNDDCLGIGCLVDMSLVFSGMIDEVVFSDYAFDEDLIEKLYNAPEEGAADVRRLVEANYPEGYTPPSTAPTSDKSTPAAEATPTPTNAVTQAPQTAKATAAKTAANSAGKHSEKNNTTTIVIIIVAVTVVIVAACIAVLLLMKKKAAKK